MKHGPVVQLAPALWSIPHFWTSFSSNINRVNRRFAMKCFPRNLLYCVRSNRRESMRKKLDKIQVVKYWSSSSNSRLRAFPIPKVNIARIALSPLAPRTAISNSLLLELQRVQGTTGCWEINVAAGGNENWQNASRKIPSDIEGDGESSSLSNQNLFKIAWFNHPQRKHKFIHFWVGNFRIVIIREIRPMKVHSCSTWIENPQHNLTWITERDNKKKK